MCPIKNFHHRLPEISVTCGPGPSTGGEVSGPTAELSGTLWLGDPSPEAPPPPLCPPPHPGFHNTDVTTADYRTGFDRGLDFLVTRLLPSERGYSPSAAPVCLMSGFGFRAQPRLR